MRFKLIKINKGEKMNKKQLSEKIESINIMIENLTMDSFNSFERYADTLNTLINERDNLTELWKIRK